MAKKIDDAIPDELLRGCERPEDLMADGGLMRELRKALTRRMPGVELTEHLGYEHGGKAPPVKANRRNGVSRKTVKSGDGAFALEVPRDRGAASSPGGSARARRGSTGWMRRVSHEVATGSRPVANAMDARG